MSDASHDPPPPAPSAGDDADRTSASGRLGGARRRLIQALAAFSLVILLAVGCVGFGLRTDPGRALLTRALDGLSLGPAGRLHLVGLSGDVLDRFRVGLIEIVDDKGPWLSAQDVAVRWRPLALLVRHVHVFELTSRTVSLYRRPHVAPRPPAPPSRPWVSVQVDHATFALTSAAEATVAEGAWTVDGGFRVRRTGAVRADVRARSLRRAGDGGVLQIRYGDHDAFRLRADLAEAEGGAAAGALGFPADQPLHLSATGAGVGATGSASGALVSGGRTVAAARASWTKGTLTGQAHLLLGVSRWTHYLSQRLGDFADVAITARPNPGGLTDTHLHVTSPGGVLGFDGGVDGRWRARDAALSVAVPSLSKWIPAPKAGNAAIQGAVSGGFTDFEVKGRLVAHDVEAAGYHMQTVSGRSGARLHGGEWRFTGDLRGEGGAGPPMTAGLLGGAPGIVLDVSVLPNGHTLVRALKIDGLALQVAASGGEGLLGGLAFTGVATLQDLARVRPGMRGTLATRFDAKEAKDADRWSFTLDATAHGLATGSRDLDHFLGASPKGAGTGTFSISKGVTFSNLEVAGQSASASGQGGVDGAGAITGAFRWRAAGPFTAGPLEVSGAAVGEAAVSGMLKAPRLDLHAELAALDLGALKVAPARVAATIIGEEAGVSGVASMSGAAGAYGPATAKTSFQAGKDEIILSDAVVDAGGVKGTGGIVLRGGRIVRTDASFLVGPGAWLESGRVEGKVRLEDGPGGATLRGAVDGTDFVIREPQIGFAGLHLKTDGPLRNLPIQIAAEGTKAAPFGFNGRAVVRAAGADVTAQVQGAGQVRKAPFALTVPAELRWGPAQTSLLLTASAAGGAVHADLRKVGEDLTGKVRADAVEISPFVADFVGRVSGELDVSGRGPKLSGRLSSRVQGLRSRDEPDSEGLSGTVTAQLEDQRLRMEADAVNVAGLKSHGQADLPAVATASPFRVAIDRTRPLSGAFSVDGEVRPLWDVLAGGERTLAGRIEAKGTVVGTLNQPLVTGAARLTDGKFRDIASGLQLQGLGVDAVLGGNALTVQKFSGADGRGGTISGDGRVGFDEGGGSTFRLVLKKFQLLDNEIGRATASGSVLVAHPAKGEGRVSGALSVDRADIVAAAPTPTGVVPMEVTEIHQKERRGQEPVTVGAGPPIALDVAVRASRGVYLKGRGLNLELSLDSRVTGTVDHPAFDGVARVVSGNYDFAGKRFDVENSGSIHLGATAAQIRLDLSATWSDPTITAVVRVQGTAAKPEITLTSSPVLPQDEVLARVLFGVSASQLAPAQGAEMASALASLAGGGGFDIIGNLRQFAGLDRLALGATQAAGTTISGGKYISKDVYLELTGGARNGTGAQVEWQIRKNLSLISRYGAALDPRYPEATDASLSIRFRRDF